MSGQTGETREELLDLPKVREHGVSEHQLARWHRAGLLPRPKQRSLGKGHGTQTVYPFGTGKQLLRLCEIHFDGKEKLFRYVGWRLWWEGYEVSFDLIRDFLSGVASMFDSGTRSLVDPRTGELSESAWQFVEDSPDMNLNPHKPLGQVRGRTGRIFFPTLVKTMFEVGAGRYEGLPLDYTEGHWEGTTEGDQRIIEKGLDLFDQEGGGRSGEVQTQPSGDVGMWLEMWFKGTSQLLRDHSYSEVLATATNEDLAKSRDQMNSLMVSLQLTNVACNQPTRSEVLTSAVSETDIRALKPRMQALGLLWWTMWRLWGPPSVSEIMDSRHKEVQQILAQLAQLGDTITISKE
jgi:hypothetical protein